MAYILIDNFSAGVDRSRPRFVGPPGSLWSGINGHLSRGGDFEKRIKMVMEGAVKEGNTIIYIDEIHNMIGAGRGSDGGPDASNMLKQYL